VAAPDNLQRFLEAQDAVYPQVLAELRAGRKTSHWMWFIFPQLQGLGVSPTARFYALGGLEEARVYLAHPVLGTRLLECTRLVNTVSGRALREIFGTPDDLKFRSCMTLFDATAGAQPEGQPFRDALARYCAGAGDPRTLELLGSSEHP
jgi:uncharacterized protein (DUF1810 family)